MANLTWNEKMEKAREAALKKAEKDGLDEAATQAAVNEAVERVTAAREKAESEQKSAKWKITVKDNPLFCGVGAGGVQFAHGEAVIESKRMAAWFTEHEGYEVEEA